MGFFEKLGEGLRKTRDSIFGSIAGLVNAGEITDELYDDLEEQLILADTGADVAMRLVEELRHLNEQLGIPATLSEVGVTADKIPAMAEDAMKSGNIAVNPRASRQSDIEVLYRRAL